MRPLFADPKNDFVFEKIFGTEEHKPLLIALLNDLLELDAPRRIVSVELLSPKQRPKVRELEYSVVDVKCIDARGTRYVVKTQILNVEEFDKRIVSNVAKTYTGQADATQQYPDLDDVVGVTICEFELWPRRELPHVPLLNRIRVGQLLFVFLELPKLDTSRPPQSTIEKWAYFFREASNLAVVPEALTERPFVDALDAARIAHFTDDEWDAYIRVGMAIQDERGALGFARKEGARTELRAALRLVLDARGLSPDAALDARIDAETDLDTLRRWLQQAISAPTAAEALT